MNKVHVVIGLNFDFYGDKHYTDDIRVFESKDRAEEWARNNSKYGSIFYEVLQKPIWKENKTKGV